MQNMQHEGKRAVRLVESEQLAPASVLRRSFCEHAVQNGEHKAGENQAVLAFVCLNFGRLLTAFVLQ